MDNKACHMLVFTTKTTLHERFTPKSHKCVSILNNAGSAALKDRDISTAVNAKRSVFISEKMETDEIRTTCNQINTDENEEKPKVSLYLPFKRERTIMSTNLKSRYRLQSYTNLINLTECKDMWNNQCHVNKKFFPLKSRPRCFNFRLPSRGARKIYRPRKRFRVYSNKCKRANFSGSGKYSYIRPLSYRWNRKRSLITKEQLDDEIDKYMADVLFSSANYSTSKGDANENFLNETETFLKSI